MSQADHSERARTQIEIDVVSDVVCPWCFVGMVCPLKSGPP